MIIRVNKTENYTVMSNYHLKEKNMSLKAKGLLSLMLSLPEDWNYSIKGLVSICKESEDSIKSGLDELKQFGYLKIIKVMPNKENKGRYEYIYDIFETPIQEGEKQPLEIQPLENTPLYKIYNNIESNIIIKENIKEKFEKFYSEYPRKVKKDLVRKWFIKNKPSDELFETMMSSLYKFKKTYDWIKENGKYIPYPSSWLNEKRWEDEIEEMKENEKEEEPVVEIFDYDWLNDGEQE